MLGPVHAQKRAASATVTELDPVPCAALLLEKSLKLKLKSGFFDMQFGSDRSLRSSAHQIKAPMSRHEQSHKRNFASNFKRAEMKATVVGVTICVEVLLPNIELIQFNIYFLLRLR